MKLRILMKHHPESPGFLYSTSDSARSRGPDSEKKELLEALRQHLAFCAQETFVVDGKEVIRMIKKEDLVAFLTHDDGTEIEKVSL